MSIKKERRISECEGKHKFQSYTQAQATMSEKLRHKVEAYHCATCGGWHIGGTKSARNKRLSNKRNREMRYV